ncbi:hypothetical protein [Cryptosporangium sp. NPDC048952]|uniref:hypothetical protein n=1 Tax=Cryptosporangium sp. NPDC048952 TaxID=3363961 RepID=UPI0037243CAD
MAKTLLLVWSTPASPDVEAEFNRWYEETHIPELRAAVGSIEVVNRYRKHGTDGATRYLTVYEVDDADVDAATATFYAGIGGTTQTDTIDMTGNPPAIEWYSHL